MAFTLHTPPNNPRAFKALIAAQYAGVTVEVPADFQMGVTNKTPAYLAKNPLGKVPVLDTPQGPLFESNAIARFIAGVRADSGLLGASHYAAGQIDQWIFWASNELDAPTAAMVYPILGYLQPNKKMAETARVDLFKALALLEAHLLHHTFLVGERVSLADITLFCSLLLSFKLLLDPATRESYPNLVRYFVTLQNQPQFLAVTGPVELCAAVHPLYSEEKKAKEPKEEKKAEKPKEEKKPKEKKPKDDDEEEEDPVLKEEKPRLSEVEAAWIAKKSDMDLDTVKRLFSNNKYEDVIGGFWESFDHSTYTMWETTYNYNDDNKIDWMTANYVGGVLQRLEEARKVAYGVITITGDKPFRVQGMFLFKYSEVPTFVKDSADYECFTYTQVDITSDAGKARMAEFWASETIDARPVTERRFLK